MVVRHGGESEWVVDIPAAGGIVFDADRRILLIRRGRPPGAGLWSVPGGKCRPGEPPAAACVREVLEETGLTVQVVRPAGRVLRPAPAGDRFVIDDFVCRVVGRNDGLVARAGDDAEAVGWFGATDLKALPLVPGLAETLTGWELFPD